jgi:cytochrome P450
MTFSSNVTFAKFRTADPEVDRNAYPIGNPIWRIAAYPLELAMKVLCTGKLYFEKDNALQWYKPRPFELIDKISGWLGFAPECAFISYFPTFLGTFYHIQDPVVIKALFKEFRGSSESNGLFTPTGSIKTLFNIIVEIFPDDDITEEDIIFTCSSKNSKYYRNWLHHLFDGKHINNYQPIIRKEAKETLESWSVRCNQGHPISIFETSLFASRIITQLMFGQKLGGETLAKAVNFINWYALHKQIGKVSQQDDIQYKEALSTFKQIVEEVINDQKAALFVDQESNSLTLAQKKAMAFIIFFAGQETTGILLGNILHFLARNEELQSALRTKIVENGREGEVVKKEIETLINHSLANLPPSYAISRRIGKKDICLEYKLEGEEKLRKLIMNPGDLVSARMIDAARRIKETAPERINQEHAYDVWSAFGGGAHSCPGKKLALTEVVEFVLTALQGYKLTADLQQEPRVIGQITLQFVENVNLTITPIQ